MGKAKEGDSFQKKGVSSKTKFPVMNLRIETDDWESLVSLRELLEVRDQERKSNCQGLGASWRRDNGDRDQRELSQEFLCKRERSKVKPWLLEL